MFLYESWVYYEYEGCSEPADHLLFRTFDAAMKRFPFKWVESDYEVDGSPIAWSYVGEEDNRTYIEHSLRIVQIQEELD